MNHAEANVTILKWLEAGSVSVTPFWIVHNDSQVGNLIAYTEPIVIPANPGDMRTGGTPTTVKFASSKRSPEVDKQSFSASVGYQYDVFIVLHYMYKEKQYGQAIPFAAIVITE